MAVSTDYSYYDFTSHILYGHRINKIPTATKALCVLTIFLVEIFEVYIWLWLKKSCHSLKTLVSTVEKV